MSGAVSSNDSRLTCSKCPWYKTATIARNGDALENLSASQSVHHRIQADKMRSVSLFSLLTVASTVTCAAAQDKTSNVDPFEQWHKPEAGHVRGPCPFLNTFANHGFLPRTGKYITQKDLADGLFRAVNFDANISAFLFDFAVSTNPEPNSTWFSLDHLTRHNVLEHDASLSRADAFHGPADVLNEAAFTETLSYYGDTLDVKSGATAIVARMKTCKATNPTYSLSDLGEAFILGETAAFISILGDAKTITADKKLVEYLFRTLSLWSELGWKRPDSAFTTDILLSSLETVETEYHKQLNATSQARKRSGGYADRLLLARQSLRS
ncbi:Chloroperoxidase [Cercophora newfieldiana]|uniref:Chloroperoxidase n=1 Tax=Cercophora newfieldiana TaxID=92897 RepID=A0AA39YCA0_9PEZI|nr:Chloroperoxidase [Cercophora newfieldiana]